MTITKKQKQENISTYELYRKKYIESCILLRKLPKSIWVKSGELYKAINAQRVLQALCKNNNK